MLMLLLAGLLGVILQVLVKMKSTKSLFDIANQTFVYKKFFEKESVAIATSIVFVLIMAITVNEWMQYKEWVQDYLRLLFTLGGAIGSWLAGYTLGRSKSFIKNIIDTKTNKADGIED